MTKIKYFLYQVKIFIIILLLQIVLLNNIKLYGFYIPYIYIYIIIFLPFKINNFYSYLIAFSIGILIDTFYDTLGLNCIACIWMTYIKLLISFFIKKKYLIIGLDNYKYINIISVYIYILVLTIIHHIIIYHLTFFKIDNFIYITINAIFNAFVSSFIMLIIKFITFNYKL